MKIRQGFILGALASIALVGIIGAITPSGYFTPMSIEKISVLLAGEDQDGNVLRVEHQYSLGLAPGADTLIKSGTGYLHLITCSGSDAAATAGDIAVRDAVSAGAGTVILPIPIAAALLLPQPVILDFPFTTGLFIDFTTTNDVTCTVSYR